MLNPFVLDLSKIAGNRSRGRKTRGRRSRGRKTRGRKFPKRLDMRAEVARAEVDPMTWAEVGYSGGRSHVLNVRLVILQNLKHHTTYF